MIDRKSNLLEDKYNFEYGLCVQNNEDEEDKSLEVQLPIGEYAQTIAKSEHDQPDGVNDPVSRSRSFGTQEFKTYLSEVRVKWLPHV